MSEKISAEQLIELLDRRERSTNCSDPGREYDHCKALDLAAKYTCWRALDSEDLDQLRLLGVLDCDTAIDGECPSEHSYGAPLYPIALRYYPNFGASIFAAGDSYFLIYREFGGHVPEMRCRCIQRDRVIV